MSDALAANLRDAAYEGVTFPVSSSQVDGGHDSAQHTAYGRRGADIEPTGLKAYSGSLEVPFINDLPQRYAINGSLYPGTYYSLRSMLENVPIGQFTHPSLGTLTAHMEAWHEQWEPDKRNGLTMTIRWIEHNASVGLLYADDGSTQVDSPATATSQALTADSAAIASGAATSGGYTAMGPVVAGLLAFLEGQVRTATQILSAINSAVATCSANIGLSALSGVSQHQLVAQLEALRGTLYRLRDRYLPDYGRFRRWTVPVPMSTMEAASILYGNASLSTLLMAANPISDPLLIPPGTVLTVLPDS